MKPELPYYNILSLSLQKRGSKQDDNCLTGLVKHCKEF